MASNKSLVPEAKEALSRFKMEAASDEDVQSDIKKHRSLYSTYSHPVRVAVNVMKSLFYMLQNGNKGI